MAYEHQTYEAIMRRVLARVPSNMDKREGSMIWDATGPNSAEVAILYTALDFILDATFADTAPREYLIKRAAERGLSPYPETFAVFRAEFNKTVPIGSRFSIGNMNYAVTERIADHDTPSTRAFRAVCETSGTIGNTLFGRMVPIGYIDGLTHADIVTTLPTEVAAWLTGVYTAAADSLLTVGGTVRLVIMDGAYGVPSQELIEDVQREIDPQSSHGEGLGIAPIGHVVKVDGVQSKRIDITLNLQYQSGWDWEATGSYISEAIDGYFNELARGWQDTEVIVVRVSQIETRVLSCQGILDVRDTLLNGTHENLTLDAASIPVRGAVSG